MEILSICLIITGDTLAQVEAAVTIILAFTVEKEKGRKPREMGETE